MQERWDGDTSMRTPDWSPSGVKHNATAVVQRLEGTKRVRRKGNVSKGSAVSARKKTGNETFISSPSKHLKEDEQRQRKRKTYL